MGGRTMPTECPHGKSVHAFCEPCARERANTEDRAATRLAVHTFPAEAVAQLVADGVLVERQCEECCKGERFVPHLGEYETCWRCKGSGRDGTYRLVLPDGEEE